MQTEEQQTLYCPTCGYNLTGLPENRCPECGAPFDPTQLARDDKIPWERHRSIHAFFATWRLGSFEPNELVRRVATGCTASSGWKYSLICYVIALSVVAATTLVVSFISFGALPGRLRAILTALSASALVALTLCESLGARVLSFLSSPAADRGYGFWRGIMHYTSGFAILSAVVPGLILFAKSDLAYITLILVPVAFGWWCTFLGQTINAACRPAIGAIFGSFVIFVAGLGSIVVAIVLYDGMFDALKAAGF